MSSNSLTVSSAANVSPKEQANNAEAKVGRLLLTGRNRKIGGRGGNSMQLH